MTTKQLKIRFAVGSALLAAVEAQVARVSPTAIRGLELPALLRAGLIGGIVAGMMLAMWQMIVGAIAQEPTAAPGIDSSFWTAITAIPSVPFGMQWFHGSFEFWDVVIGLMMHMGMSMMLGVIGVTITVSILGSRPSPGAAVVVGVMFGLVVEVVLVNLIVNNWQDVNTFYTATPEWSWWVAHGLFGMTLGLVASSILGRGDRRQPA